MKHIRNNNDTRKIKTGKAKRPRQKQQRKRLVAAGVPETTVAKMNHNVVRDLLKRPCAVPAHLKKPVA